jgi:hypothetical protein
VEIKTIAIMISHKPGNSQPAGEVPSHVLWQISQTDKIKEVFKTMSMEKKLEELAEKAFARYRPTAEKRGGSITPAALPMSQISSAFEAYRIKAPGSRQRQDLPTLDAARTTYTKAHAAHEKSRAAVQRILSEAAQRARRSQEQARLDQQEAQTQITQLEGELNQLLDRGGSDSQGAELENKLRFAKRKEEHAAQIVTGKPTLNPGELAQLREAVQEEREAANQLGRAEQDLQDALCIQLDSLFAQWPIQENLSIHNALPSSELLRNTFPQVSQYLPSEYVQAVLES